SCFSRIRRPPRPPPFPYTTLFRSAGRLRNRLRGGERAADEPGRLSRRAGADAATDPRLGPRARAAAGLGEFAVAQRRARVLHRRSEEHTSELQSRENLVCRLLLEK